MKKAVRGHLFDHMHERYCHTCAGYGTVGLFKWRYVAELKKLMPFEPEPCPTCQGTGRNGRAEAKKETKNG